MSVLSEKLSYFVRQRQENIAELSKKSGIERSTLYQYLRGKRPLQNRAHLDSLMSQLHLTPDERMSVLEAYEVEQVGVRSFKRRCKVKEIFNSLLTIDDGTYMQLQTVPCIAESGDRVSHRLVHGELDVNRAIHGVVQDAVACGGELKLLAQPDYSVLMESLTIIGNQAANTKVTQVICMESDSG